MNYKKKKTLIFIIVLVIIILLNSASSFFEYLRPDLLRTNWAFVYLGLNIIAVLFGIFIMWNASKWLAMEKKYVE